MSLLDNIYRKNISSDKTGRQILGALFQWRTKPFLAFVFLLTPLSAGLAYILSPDSWLPCLLLIGLNLLVWFTIKVCRTLTDIFSLNRNENGITACQIAILAALGFWIIGFVLIFDINGRMATAFGILGVALGWIFQDRVKGAAAFISFRRNHLLNIGDWIKVPSLGVDGEVTKVSLLSVTLYNWDTTTSTIPINALQSEHFMNLHNMDEGKTYGRRMTKSFTLDMEQIRPITEEEAAALRSGEHGIAALLPEDEIEAGALNAHLFRLYLYHWLMKHPHICQHPHLLVRWIDHKDIGLELEVYAFITDSKLSAFEWQQSLIIEHVISSMAWFGLQLYQRPSTYDFDAA